MKKRAIFLVPGIILVFFITLVFAQSMPKYSGLYPFFVDLKGWKAKAPKGSNMSGPMGEMVTAERRYTQADRKLHAQIVGGTHAMGMWAPFTTGMTYDSPDGFFKTTRIKGLSAGINHQKKKPRGSIIVQIAVGQSGQVGAVFVLNYTGLSYKDAVKIVEKFPLKGMEKTFLK